MNKSNEKLITRNPRTEKRRKQRQRKTNQILISSNICCICNQDIRQDDIRTLEHFISMAYGGAKHSNFFRVAHDYCNHRMGGWYGVDISFAFQLTHRIKHLGRKFKVSIIRDKTLLSISDKQYFQEMYYTLKYPKFLRNYCETPSNNLSSN